MESSLEEQQQKRHCQQTTKKTASSMVASSSSSAAAGYRDHSHVTDDDKELRALMDKADAEGVKGTDQSFPVKLHQLLSGSDEDGFSHVVSWQPHGRSFIVKKHAEFVDKVLPCCFRQSKFASFQRQLNLYGFRRITQGRDKGGYFHELFLRGKTLLALKMQRTKVKGTGARKASSPETEPNFYAMPYVYETNSGGKKTTPTVLASTPVASLASSSPPLAAVAAMSPAVASPPLSSRMERLEHLSSSLVKVSPPSVGATKPLTDSVARAALLGLEKPSTASRVSATSSSSLAMLPLIPPSMFTAISVTGGTGPPSLPPSIQQDLVSRMIATRAARGLDSLRDAPLVGPSGLLANSNLLSGSGSIANNGIAAQPGRLHLNSLGMPCNCAIPAF